MARNAEEEARPRASADGVSGISEGRVRALLANVADMVTITDRDGRSIYASPATEKVSGYTPEEFVASHPFDSIHPDDRPRCEEALTRLEENPGLSLDLEHRVRHKDGTWRWVEGTFTSLFDDPEVGGLLATVRDITARKRVEEALREREEQLALALQAADAGVSSLDLATGTGVTTPQWREVLGMAAPPAQQALEVLLDLIHPDDRERVAALHADPDGVREGLDFEFRLNHPEKGERWILSRSRHVPTPDGAGRLVGIALDITERKRAEESSRLAAQADAFRVGLADALRPLTDPAEIEEQATRVLGEHLGANRVMYAAVEGDGRSAVAEVERCYASGVPPLTGRFTMADFGLSRSAAHRSGPTVVADVTSQADFTDDEKARYADADIGAWVGVPLIKDGRFVAALGVHHREPRSWTPQEIMLIGETAERTWSAVERARAEEALRESEERLQRAIAIETVGVFFLDQEGRVTDANDSFLSMSGLGREDLESVSWQTLTPPEWITHTERAFEELEQTGKTTPYEKEFLRRDGSRRWGLFAATRLDAQEVAEFVVDITERKRFETERTRLKSREAAMRAEAAERKRISRELHDRVAHSMGVVYQNLQLHNALEESAPERAREKLAVAEDNARSALDQTRSLAIELRRSVAEETENGLAAALRTLVATSTPDGVVAELSLSGDESLVPRDVGAQVYLVMREAIRNVLKHSGNDSFVASLQIGPDELVGAVTDDGDGFDSEAAQNDGRGTGLRSMRERARMVGGEVKIISHPGAGTTVEVRVPLQRRA